MNEPIPRSASAAFGPSAVWAGTKAAAAPSAAALETRHDVNGLAVVPVWRVGPATVRTRDFCSVRGHPAHFTVRPAATAGGGGHRRCGRLEVASEEGTGSVTPGATLPRIDPVRFMR